MASPVTNEVDVEEFMKYRQSLWMTYNSTTSVDFFGCPRGCISLGQHVKHDSSDILSLFSCPSCLKNWVVCRSCSCSRKAFDDGTKLKRHLTNFHKEILHLDGKKIRKLFQYDALKINIDSAWDSAVSFIDHICQDIEDQNVIQLCADTYPSLDKLKLCIKSKKIVATNDWNLQFFEKNHQGYGGSYLIGKSQFHLDNITTELNPTEVWLHL